MTIAPVEAPVQASEAGPVSEQAVGAVPRPGPVQAMREGPIETQPQGATAAPAPNPTPFLAASAFASAQASHPQSQATPKVAQLVTKAISLGLAQMPDTAAGWARLVTQFSSPQAQDELQAQEGQFAASQAPATGVASRAGTGGLAKFLWAIRQHESGGDYQAYNAAGGASGAYQFIDSTWAANAKAAGFGAYAGRPARTAPPSVQDAVAAHMAESYYGHYHTWGDVAESWYDPSLVGRNVVPDPQAGNTESVTGYGSQILAMMGQAPAEDRYSPNAGNAGNVVQIAASQIGTPYQWGGESPKRAFDCSGLVQWTYRQAGVDLPRVAQTQYDATAKLAPNAALAPGDLLFFGQGPNRITHVGLYVGDGYMVDAPHSGADVRTDLVFPALVGRQSGTPGRSSWGDYVGATRPLDPSGASTGENPLMAGSSPFAPPGHGPTFNSQALYAYVVAQMEGLG